VDRNASSRGLGVNQNYARTCQGMAASVGGVAGAGLYPHRRARGLTTAETGPIKQPQEAKLLTDYYRSMLEGLFLPLEEVVRDTKHRTLAGKQVGLKIDQEPWVFLVTLGTQPRRLTRQRGAIVSVAAWRSSHTPQTSLTCVCRAALHT
jgi:hypothetical protein